MDDVAGAAHVGRRTLFRYFPSKNDIVWGDFNRVLERLGHHLAETAPDAPLMQAITHAAIESNRYPPDQLPELRVRMSLITAVPALQAHSMVRYADWRAVISIFAARRLGQQPGDLIPLAVGYAALGASLAAFSRWVAHPQEDLIRNLEASYEAMCSGFSVAGGSN
jgi:mycofactocin system transcriptional regulator